jgi:hypothetical protein
LIEESRCLECELPVGFVDIEHASLHSRICRGFRFVDRRSNAVDVEDPARVRPPSPAPMIATDVFILIPCLSEVAVRSATSGLWNDIPC